MEITYIMTPSGMDGQCATFGPFLDRSLALVAADKLRKAGLDPLVVAEREAIEMDCHGVAMLKARACGKPIDWS